MYLCLNVAVVTWGLGKIPIELKCGFYVSVMSVVTLYCIGVTLTDTHTHESAYCIHVMSPPTGGDTCQGPQPTQLENLTLRIRPWCFYDTVVESENQLRNCIPWRDSVLFIKRSCLVNLNPTTRILQDQSFSFSSVTLRVPPSISRAHSGQGASKF